MACPESPILPVDQLTALIPELRACARALCRDAAWADDLTQEALLKAWSNASQFEAGTNFRGWMFTILRNTFLTSVRRRQREVQDTDSKFALRMSVDPAQEHRVELTDLQRCLGSISTDQREAILMVGPVGYSYQEAAERCGCAVGSIKSRVSRARRSLMQQLDGTREAQAEEAPCPVRGKQAG
jgi:RNA polymerase sigma-70 factor (ECF subfamily)